MKAQRLREKFLTFYKQRGHEIIPSAPLVPVDDPTSLFISAGMQPLIPYLLGEPHPLGKRLANIQKCVRTVDIDEVGDNRHLTFFEMLGNWSLGDYFKKEQLPWAFEFLTAKEWLGLDPNRLYISVLEGNQNAPRDEEAIAVWRKIFKDQGLSHGVGDRIFLYPKEENWWGPVGETGPCGPDSEIFYDTQRPHNPQFGKKCHINCDCGHYLEIWNNVFMEYNQVGEGKYEKLKDQNVDTGMGFERVVAILQNKETPYETDLFTGVIGEMEEISGLDYQEEKNQLLMRIVADHLRAAVFVIAAGVIPSNVDRGYVLRRLIRRAIRHGRLLGIEKGFTPQVARAVIEDYRANYPELEESREKIFNELQEEEKRFGQTLERGLREFRKVVFRAKGRLISGGDAFSLYDTFGFPLELTRELAEEKGLEVDEAAFQKAFATHKEKSRQGAKQKFAGGMADQSPEAIKLHTATHLLHAALRLVLGDGVQQKGSNITSERLRFDFSHPKKLTAEELEKVEALVNQKIKENLSAAAATMSLEEAQKRGALAFFGQKYGEKVKVYSIGSFSKEVCGGPHVTSTGELGRVRITKSEKIGGGILRIYATLETAGR